MLHLAVHIFAVFAFLALGWTVFFAWVIGVICRGLWIGLTRLSGRPQPVTAKVKFRNCTRLRCRATNPPQANFCRRCGSSLTQAPVERQTSVANGAPWASGSSNL